MPSVLFLKLWCQRTERINDPWVNCDIYFLCLPDMLAKQVHIYWCLFNASKICINPRELWSIYSDFQVLESFSICLESGLEAAPPLLYPSAPGAQQRNLSILWWWFGVCLVGRLKISVQGCLRGFQTAGCWISWQAWEVVERFISYKTVHCNLCNHPRKE